MDVLSYGNHSPLGNTLDIPEEKDPPEGYEGHHRWVEEWEMHIGDKKHIKMLLPEPWKFGI